uniref:Chemosensory protein 3 n=2 Tax=Anopheles atroparvus TaxID=41427 RepID=A0A182JK44_ANOAO
MTVESSCGNLARPGPVPEGAVRGVREQTIPVKMKFFVVVALALVAAVAAQEKYTTKYDGVDLDEILKSDRLFNNYFKCLMDQGRCTPDGNELKRILPDALLTDCAKCSEKQKSGTDKVINYLIDNRKSQWDALQAKYDPDNTYVNKYREEANKKGIKL